MGQIRVLASKQHIDKRILDAARGDVVVDTKKRIINELWRAGVPIGYEVRFREERWLWREVGYPILVLNPDDEDWNTLVIEGEVTIDEDLIDKTKVAG